MRPLLAAALAFMPLAAPARTLLVGDGREFPLPSSAIAAAHDGDIILIDPGSYFDCATVAQNRLEIAGAGPKTVITDKACQGKALLVVDGDEVTIRDLTLARARVPDENGAGIRLQAPSLHVQHVTFDNDQVGILSGASGGQILVEDSFFTSGGVGGDTPLFAVLVGYSVLLRVTNSTFSDVKGGQIFSSAARTEIIGNAIGSGAGDAPASAILVTAGAALIQDNVITIGPNRPRRDAAVALWDDATGTLRHNRLINQTGKPLTLLLDWTWGDPVLDHNIVDRSDEEVSTSGLWRHRISTEYHTRRAEIRAFAGRVKRFIQSHL